MPTYEYECKKCGHRFEKFQSMKDHPVKTCPQCRQDAAQRLIGSGSGVIFKGSGFYATDYRKGAKPAAPCPSAGEKPGCSRCPKNPSS